MGIKHEDVKVSGDVGRASEWNKDHKIDGPIDFNKNEAQSFVIENRTSFPAGPVEGQIIYRTDQKLAYIWDGTSWQRNATEDDIIDYVSSNVPFLSGDLGRWSCSGCNFDVQESTYAWWKNNGIFIARSNDVYAYASVEGLPDGALLTSAYASGTGGKTWILHKKNIVTDEDTVIATAATNLACMISPAEAVDNSSYVYYFRVGKLAINEKVVGARIAYEYP